MEKVFKGKIESAFNENDELEYNTKNGKGYRSFITTWGAIKEWFLSGLDALYAPLTVSVEDEMAGGTTSQAEGTPITAKWSRFTSGAGGGAVLTDTDAGSLRLVINDSAGDIYVYPPVGHEINNLGADQPFVFASGARRNIFKITDTHWTT